MQVCRGSGLAEQQQRQLESALVEPHARVPWDFEDEGCFRYISGEFSCLRVLICLLDSVRISSCVKEVIVVAVRNCC